MINSHYPLAVGGTDDHLHVLVKFDPEKSIMDLVEEIKSASENFVNDLSSSRRKFSWSLDYGAFSCGPAEIDEMKKFINNQAEYLKKFRAGRNSSTFSSRTR